VAINTIRTLAADVVQKANSGHPGMPMGMAPVGHVLWSKILRFSPTNSKFRGRDRFVLSNGHGCVLQYILLHLSGFDMSLDDLKQFRQLHSKTPGHPEVHLASHGIEVTTGPLGQGLANGVGLAMGEAHMAATFNRPGFPLFDNYTYVFCGDGCLQEGVTSEAASLAGHLGLGKLIVIYDDNKVTIDGPTSLSFSEDVPKRHEAYGWHAITVKDGDHDIKSIEEAIRLAQSVKDKPSIISVKTTIGFGATKQGTQAVHGEALGEEEVKKVKKVYGFDPEKKFAIPQRVLDLYRKKIDEGKKLEAKWNDLFRRYEEKYPKEAKELKRRFDEKLPEGWKNHLPKYTPQSKANATRNLSQEVLNGIAGVLPELVGGSADLTPSTKTNLKDFPKDFSKKSYDGRYIRYGVREHGMAAIGNGLHAYGGIVPYTSTFLNFITYAWGAVRLAAVSEHHHIFVMTHDSIGLGEDGPTHQPIEAIALIRGTPGINLIRPADGNETAGAYIAALETHGPTVLALSRQNLPHLENSSPEKVLLGAYVVHDAKDHNLIFVATGSEVSGALEAAKILESKDGLHVRVVSMPSTDLFDKQPVHYRRSILTPGVPVISVEAASVIGWARYAHFHIGMTTFGASAPIAKLLDHFGFTPEKIASTSRKYLKELNQQIKDLSFPSVFPLPVHVQSNL